MSTRYRLCAIPEYDRAALAEVEALLRKSGLTRDAGCDYIAGLYDGERLVATGACLANSLRCLAVDADYQGEGLLGQIVTHLIEFEYARGCTHLFLYTKCETARFFHELGFREIARVQERLVFMENRADGFAHYLRALERGPGRSAAIVLNANPFTRGHAFLVAQAAAQNDTLHLFVVSEDRSFFPASARLALVRAGVEQFSNVSVHETGSYLISSAVFPAYFLKTADDAADAQAALDAALFVRIAERLGVTRRYLGEEPASELTRRYNSILSQCLPQSGIECVILPRLRTANGAVISASTVRRRLAEGESVASLADCLPETTLDYLASPAGQAVIARLRAARASSPPLF